LSLLLGTFADACPERTENLNTGVMVMKSAQDGA